MNVFLIQCEKWGDKMRKADCVTGVVLILIGVYILTQSLQLGMTRNGITGPGFVSFWIGSGLILAACVLIALSFCDGTFVHEKTTTLFDGDSLTACGIYAGGAILVVSLVSVLGFMVPVGIYVAAVAKLRGVKSWGQSVLLGVGTTIFIYVLFAVLLRVPLPAGPFHL
jgi:hypothetical protein